MARTVAIGKQNFKAIRENNYFYVDKTSFIKKWWENGDDVTLITRPRRFGKTLTMSMVENFFSIENAGREDLFVGLSIWEEEKYRQLQGTYPVIFLSFADVEAATHEDMVHDIGSIIAGIFEDNRFLLNSSALSDAEKDYYVSITENTSKKEMPRALQKLSKFLYRYYGKKVIILLDEYDTPMQEAYTEGYWDEMVDFTRALFKATFKTNPSLERAIMTGITRVSKESVFSGLNNLEVITTTSNKYQTSFGFTEKEVFDSLDEFDLSSEKQGVKEWYDGFCFGDCKNIYNPWSIINFLNKRKYGNYWANTSSNALVGKLIQEGNSAVKAAMGDLLQGKSFHTVIDEEIVFKQLDYDPDAIWSLLLASGYLKMIDGRYNDSGHYECLLALTNKEVRHTFEDMFKSWFAAVKENYNGFTKALLSNDLECMMSYLEVLAEEMISDLDSGNKPSKRAAPERFYHGLVLGLIAELQTVYRVESNRESGLGRYDVMIIPKDKERDGIIMEFKVFDPKKEKDLQSTADNAIKQIVEKKYAVSLRTSGVPYGRIRIYGFAFEGKEVLIEGGYLSAFEGKDSPCPH